MTSKSKQDGLKQNKKNYETDRQAETLQQFSSSKSAAAATAATAAQQQQ